MPVKRQVQLVTERPHEWSTIASIILSDSKAKSAGIKEIARALGISIGTVDRALHGRPGVSPKTLSKVLRTAESLNYKPNLAARNLKLNRTLRIAVHLPQEIASFFDSLRDGIHAAARNSHGLNLQLDFRTFPRLGDGDVELLEKDIGRDYDGVIVTPGDPVTIDPLIRRLAQQGAAVVCVANDAPRTDRIAGISVDATASGGIAAELLARTIKENAFVATITGNLSTLDHAEKLRGFAATLATFAPHLTLIPAIESHERPKEAYQATLALLHHSPRPAGLYISTANSLPVLRALEEKKLLNQVQIITTDLFADLISLVESGKILATLYQRPFTQGKLAFEALIRFLLDGVRPDASVRLAPHIVLRSNLPLFLKHIHQNGTDRSAGNPTNRLHAKV
ncbi:MAG TPA: LacI family DNA-binding transcriptional regulator [Bryocella sp.]|nr:LacI family DNA-binding transcriptional regulator [Bryocella sp.]